MVADYKKKNKNDISLTAGETVDVVERNDYGKDTISWHEGGSVVQRGRGGLVTLHSISSTSF